MNGPVLAFFGGAVYEACAVLWVRYAERGNAGLAAAMSGVCAGALVAGVGESIREPWSAPFFVLGYAAGTYAAVKLSWRFPPSRGVKK